MRELEADGLIKREISPEVPSRVEYSLTTKGRKFIPVIDIMENSGKNMVRNLSEVKKCTLL